MAQIIIDVDINGTTSSGTYSFNTQNIVYGYLSQIVLKAASTDTDFGFRMVDNRPSANVVLDTVADGEVATGSMRMECNIPLVGIYTCSIISASADEVFTSRLMIAEG